MQKNKGQWTITEEGKVAYDKYKDPADFMRQAAKLYRAVEKRTARRRRSRGRGRWIARP